jgi:hypothetical protein
MGVAMRGSMASQVYEGHDVEPVAHAMHAIWSKAADLENDINCQAGELGCGHINGAAGRRFKARQRTHRRTPPSFSW